MERMQADRDVVDVGSGRDGCVAFAYALLVSDERDHAGVTVAEAKGAVGRGHGSGVGMGAGRHRFGGLRFGRLRLRGAGDGGASPVLTLHMNVGARDGPALMIDHHSADGMHPRAPHVIGAGRIGHARGREQQRHHRNRRHGLCQNHKKCLSLQMPEMGRLFCRMLDSFVNHRGQLRVGKEFGDIAFDPMAKDIKSIQFADHCTGRLFKLRARGFVIGVA